MWEAADGGRRLHFHLAGINNQNFLMEDEETRSWWQQVTGEAVRGPLRGHHLRLVPSEETTFALFVSEHPEGQVLRLTTGPGRRDVEADWEAKTLPLPVPAGSGGAAGPLSPRTLLLGLDEHGDAKAYPVAAILRQSPVLDTLGGRPIALLAGPDGRTIRAFAREVGGAAVTLFAKPGQPGVWFDSETGSSWDFSGRAVSGSRAGAQLPHLDAFEDDWFDWHNYHPATAVYAPR